MDAILEPNHLGINDSDRYRVESFDKAKQKRGGNMIASMIVAWLLFNVAIAGWLTWVRIVRPDREKLRGQERYSIVAGFPLARRRRA